MIKKFPVDKYRYIVTDNMVIAISSYAGKLVKGVAKCDPSDTFDVEKGKLLAAARCNEKVCSKRLAHATNVVNEVEASMCYWADMYEKYCKYKADALNAYATAALELKEIRENM